VRACRRFSWSAGRPCGIASLLSFSATDPWGNASVEALLQMATYAERLTVLQGVAPEFIHVVTGDGESRRGG
jgi:hypothetical protein